MSFRDDGEAQKHRIDALEDELATARAEADRMRQERDEALAGPKRGERFARGAKVWVEWNGTWWRATVKNVIADALWEIHYDGWSSKWDEGVGPSRIAPGEAPAPGPIGGGLAAAVPVLLVLMLLIVSALLAWWALSVT